MRRSKRVALLAYLTVARPHGFHRRDKIVALFWPELPADRARAALRTTLTRLRDDHGMELILGRGADEIGVDTTRLQCDVLEFDAALQDARYDEAVARYRGPFMDGVHVEGTGEEVENWIAGERARIREGAVRALGALSTAAESRRDLPAALAAARRALDIAPSDELLARRVIGLLVAAGNRGGAMQVYTDLVQRLQSEFNVYPAAETAALIAPLRAQVDAPRSVPVPAPAPDARPAGDAIRAADAQQPTVTAPRARRMPWYLVAAAALIAVVGGLTWFTLHDSPPPPPPPPLGSAPAWRAINAIGYAPPGRFGARAVLDSTGNALLVFGGVSDLDRKELMPLGEEYWRLRGLGAGDGAAWTRITPVAGPHPSARWLFGVAPDAAHDRVIVHGGALGFTSPCANDTWILNHASAIGHSAEWRRVTTRGQAAPARADFDPVYDARRNRLIVFAGHDCFYPKFSDTWVLAFDDTSLATGTWSLLAPDSSAGMPVQRDAYTAVYDTVAGRLFIFGGRASAVPTGELWTLDHAAGVEGKPVWRPVRCAGDAPALVQPASAMDFQTDTWTVFGGEDMHNQATRIAWQLHGVLRDVAHCRWEELPSAVEPSPAARYAASAALLPGAGGMVVFGGEFGNVALSDAWVVTIARPTDPPRR